MKKNNIFYILGVLLVLASVGLILFNSNLASQQGADIPNITRKIQHLMPQPTAAVPDQYTQPEMPVCQIDGTDYCALLKVPILGITLPVADSWHSDGATPGRYSGSSYDSSMIIGGKADKYQLGFVTQLDIGDKIAVIDMLGGQFNYTVERIDRAKTLDSEKLTSTNCSLTLFAYVAKEKKYVVVRCGA